MVLEHLGAMNHYEWQKGIPEALDSVPAGYKVIETERTGMPILKKA